MHVGILQPYTPKLWKKHQRLNLKPRTTDCREDWKVHVPSEYSCWWIPFLYSMLIFFSLEEVNGYGNAPSSSWGLSKVLPTTVWWVIARQIYITSWTLLTCWVIDMYLHRHSPLRESFICSLCSVVRHGWLVIEHLCPLWIAYQLVSSVECPICHDSLIVQLPIAPSLHIYWPNPDQLFPVTLVQSLT